MTYAEAVARLLALRGGEHAGMRPGLERVEGLLGALGNPERRYTLVQVGGTNGKGSVAAMLAAALRAAGRRVGLYTSPHLVSFRERIRVDGEPIPEDAVVDGVDALGTLVVRFDASMFEATTALALDWFASAEVDVAVLEVGLGGRLDATTVGRPAVTILSAIDLDHQAYLGDTLASVAREKAAIVRSGLALSAAQAPEAMAIVDERARAVGVPLLVEGRDLHVRVERREPRSQWIDCRGPGWRMERVELALLGLFQPGNALLAAAAARALDVPAAAVRQGLARVHWPGRFDVRPLREGGWLVLDGAHNPAGARALAASLDAWFPDHPVTLVLGISGDKDAGAMLAALAPRAQRLILTASSNARSVSPASLQTLLPTSAAPVHVAASPAEALEIAARPPRTPVVCVAGSLFLVGDVLRRLEGDNPCPIEKAAASMDSLF